jgi:hypothetical protein
MTITVNYLQRPSPGYTPRRPLTLHNVESVHDAGVHMVRVRMMFSDNHTIQDHVAGISIKPETE